MEPVFEHSLHFSIFLIKLSWICKGLSEHAAYFMALGQRETRNYD